MTETTQRGRKPKDHQQKAGTAAEAMEDAREKEELLADLPALQAPIRLRYRERGRVKQIMAEAIGRDVFRDGEDGIEFDVHTEEDRKRLDALYDVVGMIDEFAESLALDREAYIEWSRDKSESHFFAILSLYNEAVGESNGS